MKNTESYWWARNKITKECEPVKLCEGFDKLGVEYEFIWAIGTEHMYKKKDFDLIQELSYVER